MILKGVMSKESIISISAVNILLVAFLVNDQYRTVKLGLNDINAAVYMLFGSICIISTIFQLFIMNEFVEGIKKKSEYDEMKCQIASMEELNKVNRMQRHDYRNHLTVINGLVLLDKKQQLKEYIGKLIEETHSQGFQTETGIKELDILLEAKNKEADDKGIYLECINNAELSNLIISPFALVKVFSNIIDNAIQALSDTQRGDRKIIFSISEDIVFYIFTISNNGSKIPEEIASKIFEQGYSTKAKEGRGYGLYIVKKTLNRYNGIIDLISTEKETKFTIRIPKI